MQKDILKVLYLIIKKGIDMKKILLILLFTCLTINTNKSYSQVNINLDQSATKPVTIRTEIERGHSAIFECGLKYETYDYFGYSDCVNNVNYSNKQKNTDTEAYYLGANMANWMELVIKLDTLKNSTLVDQDVKNLMINDANLSFKNFKKIQKSYKIEDNNLVSIVKLNSDMIIPILKEWELKN